MQLLNYEITKLLNLFSHSVIQLFSNSFSELTFEPVPVPVRYATPVRATKTLTTSVGGIMARQPAALASRLIPLVVGSDSGLFSSQVEIL